MDRIAVVIPCFRVRSHILNVLSRIGPEVSLVVVVDDACPEHSGELVRATTKDPRVKVVCHAHNQGVGGAVLTGYEYAAERDFDVIVKIDGDGQMDPALIPRFAAPIIAGTADYTKGNRFYNPRNVASMPMARIFGNATLSFMNKASSGYWSIFDPTNGFTAISARLIDELPLDKIANRYFFESDMLFRLGTLRAVVLDIPMAAIYADEKSGLNIWGSVPDFLRGHSINAFKRVFYNYYLRGFSAASIELLAGGLALLFGVLFGGYHWLLSITSGIPASTGTVMVAALPVIVGFQLLISFLNYDIASSPRTAIHPLMNRPDCRLSQ